MNEDIYTIEKRNEMIQKAIKSYKFNELDLKIKVLTILKWKSFLH